MVIHASEPKPTNLGSSSYGSTKSVVRSTRTTGGLAKDADPPLHSQTTLLPASSSSKSNVIDKPLPDPPLQEEYNDDTTLRAPHRMPIPDIRESSVSLQTAPISYYTLYENWSTGASPAPQTADHTRVQKDTYENLWSAMAAGPDSAAPPMPSAGPFRMPEPNQPEPEYNATVTTPSSAPRPDHLRQQFKNRYRTC